MNFCKAETSAKALRYPIAQVIKRTAEATGVSESTVKQIKRQVKKLDRSGTYVLSTHGKYRKKPES